MSELPPNTPILVSYSTVQQKQEDLSQADEAISLMTQACQQAAAKIQQPDLLQQCSRIYVPEGMWGYSDPARIIAERIGAEQACSVFAKIGITQQTLMGEACARIQQGLDEIIIVSGGEAKYRSLQATIQGKSVSEIDQQGAEADVVMQPDAELWLIEETTAGLGMPVSYYAVMESAYRAAKGLGIEQHRDALAELYAEFSNVASSNPHAWKPQAVADETIRNASDKNKMLAFPYTKLHNTSWNVDQACAMIFTSVEKATALGIDPKHWIFPWVSTENNAMQAVAARTDIHRSIGAELAAKAAMQHCDISASELNIIDLYSCFPVAVEIYADAFGIQANQPHTCTGGMPFAGGPLNNYALQAACRAFELLDQAQDSSIALTSSVSGLITKQGFGLWSKQPPKQAFEFIDVSQQVSEIDRPLTVIGGYQGDAKIVGYTVTYQGHERQRAIAICDLPDGRRTVSYSEDSALMQQLEVQEWVGQTVQIDDRIFSACA